MIEETLDVVIVCIFLLFCYRHIQDRFFDIFKCLGGVMAEG